MRPIATDVMSGLSLCLYSILRKRINRSRCCSGYRLGWTRHLFVWGPDPHRKGKLLKGGDVAAGNGRQYQAWVYKIAICSDDKKVGEV